MRFFKEEKRYKNSFTSSTKLYRTIDDACRMGFSTVTEATAPSQLYLMLNKNIVFKEYGILYKNKEHSDLERTYITRIEAEEAVKNMPRGAEICGLLEKEIEKTKIVDLEEYRKLAHSH